MKPTRAPFRRRLGLVALVVPTVLVQWPSVAWSGSPEPGVMDGSGLDEPVAKPTEVRRPRDSGILLGFAFGIAALSVVMGRVAFLPDCTDEHDFTTCAVPSAGDIGVRTGRLIATVGFSFGGAAFGALGGRELGLLLQQSTPQARPKRQKIAVGVGAAAVAVGAVSLVVGSTVLGVGIRRSLDIAAQFDDNTPVPLGPEDLARVEAAVGQVKVARGGLMVLAMAPTFLASGIALLVHRPRASNLTVSPVASGNAWGVRATLRF